MKSNQIINTINEKSGACQGFLLLVKCQLSRRKRGLPRAANVSCNRKSGGTPGFTVIELLVGFTMFATVLSIVSSVFITSIRSQRGIAALMTANDNTYLMTEQMAREIRVGTNFGFTSFNGDVGGFEQFIFENRRGDTIIYRFIAPSGGVPGRIERSASNVLGGTFKTVSASDVNIDRFFVTNMCALNPVSPVRVTLFMRVGALGSPNIEGIFNDIQTTISTRNLARCS